MSVRQRPCRPLNVFLIKEGVSIEEAVVAGGTRSYACDTVALGARIYLRGKQGAPKWLQFLQLLTPEQLPVLATQSASALLIIPIKDRLMALTFGYGRSFLAQNIYEENFGLRVTLNSVDSLAIKSIDKKELDQLTRHSRVNGSRSGELNAFGFNPGQDMLRAVTGTPRDVTLGSRMTGMDALSVNVRVDQTTLVELLERYLGEFYSDAYVATYPQVDNIKEVRDKQVVANLDDKVVERLKTRSFDRIWIAAPGAVDWQRVERFVYDRSTEKHPDMHLSTFIDTFTDKALEKLSSKVLRDRYVDAIDADEHLVERMSIYSCLYAEVSDGPDSYLLTDKKWYKINQAYIDEVNEEVASLSRSSTLPDFDVNADTNEYAYNSRVASGAGLILMDQEIIYYGGGQSKIEFCDLLSPGYEMVHVKIYSGSSSVLSHLFAQGVVSATTYASSPEFRQKVEEKIVAIGAVVPWTIGDAPRLDEMRVVYAIVSSSLKQINEIVPFFGKVAFVSAARQLKPTGVSVVIEKILER